MKTPRLVLLLALPLAAQVRPAPTKSVPKTPARTGASAPASRLSGSSPRDLKFPALKTVTPPAIETFQLPNGMRLFLMEDHDLPLVSGTALVRTGTLLDPPDQIGLAGLTAALMRAGGTQQKTGEQLDEQLDNLAASVDSSMAENLGFVTFSALRENLGEVLAIFHDVLTAPQFRQDKLDVLETQMGGAIARRNDDPAAIGRREFRSAVYGKNNPFGWQANYSSLAQIGLSEVRTFYKRYYFPANVMLAVRGDFTAADLKPRIEALFASWHETAPPPVFPSFEAQSAAGVYLAEKKDVGQAYFYAGQLGSDLKDPDAAALRVMAAILGGGSQSRLRLLPAKSGISQITARWTPEMSQPGLFEIAGTAKTEMLLDALKAVLQEVERFQKGPITDEEFRIARDSALNSLAFGVDTRAKFLNQFLSFAYFGYPEDFSAQTQRALSAVTKADVERVAKARLDPSKFTILVVANTIGFVPELQSLGRKVTVLDLSAAPAKAGITHTSEDARAQGKQILARAQQAVGGAEKLAAIHDFTVVQEFQLAAGNAQKLTRTERWLAPDYYRQENETRLGKNAVYSDGKVGRITTSQGPFPATAVQMKQIRGDALRLPIRLLLSDRMEGRTVSATDSNTVEIGDGNGNVVRLTIDVETGMPASMSYDVLPPNGPPLPVLETFTTFRDIAGIRIPDRITILQRGQKFAEVSVVSAQINKGTKLEELQSIQ